MGSLVLQAPAQPVDWPSAGCPDVQPPTSLSTEGVLATITLVLWGLVVPLDLALSLLAT
jgi:hypothetical protein